MRTRTPIHIPAPTGLEYTQFQLKGIRYALGARGTIIADDMGLGKTIEAIGVINATPEAVRVLVICPAFLKLNWRTELDKWLVHDVKVELYSYQALETVCGQFLNPRIESLGNGANPIDVLIIDEAHYIKNPEAKRSQYAERIAKHAKRVLVLTGTPVENGRPIELWQLLKIACPEKWCVNPRIEKPYVVLPDRKKSHPGEGAAFWQYAERYCGLREVTYELSPGRTRKALDFGGATNLEEFHARLKNTCMLRRRKVDVLPELPEKRRQLIVIESTANDVDLYPGDIDESNYFDVLDTLKEDKPKFSEWSKRRHKQALKKLDACIRFIGDALESSEKIVVFAHHSDVIAKLVMAIQCEYDNADSYVEWMTGERTMEERSAAVHAFQTDARCRVIVGSIGTMGVGWTLTAAQHAIFVELDPVPDRITQCEDRLYRIGQRFNVLIQHLIANGSLCCRMAKIAVRKQENINAIVDGIQR